MEFFTGVEGREAGIADLFAASFTASAGAEEGAMVGGLARDLLGGTPAGDIRVFRAEDDDGKLIGAAIFTRLVFPGERLTAFLLSPMAVAADRRGQGIGRALIAHALGALGLEGVGAVFTYGDPEFYGRSGFRPVPESLARAPHPLGLPHGWQGRTPAGGPVPRLRGRPRAVPALDRGDIW